MTTTIVQTDLYVMDMSDDQLTGLMISLPDGGADLITTAKVQLDTCRAEDPETSGIEIATARKVFYRLCAAQAAAEKWLRSRK